MVRRLALALLLSVAAVPSAAAQEQVSTLTVAGPPGTYAFDLRTPVTVDLAKAHVMRHGAAIWGFWLERADRAPGTPYGGRFFEGGSGAVLPLAKQDVLRLPPGRYVVSTTGDRHVTLSMELRGTPKVRATRVATRPILAGNAGGESWLTAGRMSVRMRFHRPARAAFLRLQDTSIGWLGPGTAEITVVGPGGRRTVAKAPAARSTLAAPVWPEMLAPEAFEPEFALEGDAVQTSMTTFAIVVF